MNIAFDIHGTLDESPEIFKPMLEIIYRTRIEIFIISGPPIAKIEKELQELGYLQSEHYNRLISVVDFLKAINTKMWQDEKGDWWCDDCDWWASKAKICQHFCIDTMVDDKKQYQKHFTNHLTKFVLWEKGEEIL